MITLEQCKEKLEKCFEDDIEVKIQDGKLYLKAFTDDKTSWVFLSSITYAFRELGLEVISESCGVSAYLFETKIKEV